MTGQSMKYYEDPLFSSWPRNEGGGSDAWNILGIDVLFLLEFSASNWSYFQMPPIILNMDHTRFCVKKSKETFRQRFFHQSYSCVGRV